MASRSGGGAATASEPAPESAAAGDAAIVRALLDVDLRDVARGGLPPEGFTADGVDVVPGPVILQIVALVNVAQPSYQQHPGSSTRLLVLTLTDGKHKVQALEHTPVKGLSMSSPPGLKMRVRGVTVARGTLLLSDACVEVLGGHVPQLVETWKASRDAGGRMGHERASTLQQPPPFVPFGEEVIDAKSGGAEGTTRGKSRTGGGRAPSAASGGRAGGTAGAGASASAAATAAAATGAPSGGAKAGDPGTGNMDEEIERRTLVAASAVTFDAKAGQAVFGPERPRRGGGGGGRDRYRDRDDDRDGSVGYKQQLSYSEFQAREAAAAKLRAGGGGGGGDEGDGGDEGGGDHAAPPPPAPRAVTAAEGPPLVDVFADLARHTNAKCPVNMTAVNLVTLGDSDVYLVFSVCDSAGSAALVRIAVTLPRATVSLLCAVRARAV